MPLYLFSAGQNPGPKALGQRCRMRFTPSESAVMTDILTRAATLIPSSQERQGYPSRSRVAASKTVATWNAREAALIALVQGEAGEIELRAALQFYASPENWWTQGGFEFRSANLHTSVETSPARIGAASRDSHFVHSQFFNHCWQAGATDNVCRCYVL